jgi:hypothetical protein
LAGAFGLAASVGCGDESRPSDASFGSTNGQQLCAAIEQAAGSCGAPSSCEQALVQDCSALVGLLAEPYVEAMIDCIDGGTDPLGCLAGGLAALSPTAAQRAFGAQFCAECAMGLPSCEATLFSGDGDTALAGQMILPFSDSLVDELAAECAVGATCATTFVSCAQAVIARRALPEHAIECLVDSVTGTLPADQQSACGAGSDETDDGADTGGSGDGAAGGGSGNDGSQEGTIGCMIALHEPDNDSESTAPFLGVYDDCEYGPWLIVDLPPGDVDWYSYRGLDSFCRVNPWVKWQPYGNLDEVCMFFECDGVEVTCPVGTTTEISPEGRPGCCGALSFEAEINCAGLSDDALVYVRLANPSDECQEGVLDLQY